MNLREYFNERLKNLSDAELRHLNEDLSMRVSHVFDPDEGPHSGTLVKIMGLQYKIQWDDPGVGVIYNVDSLFSKNVFVVSNPN